MSPRALGRTLLRPFAAALLLAASIAGAQTVTFAPSVIGKPVALEGQLEVLVEDYADGHTRLRHFLKTPQDRIELKFAGKPPQLPSGTRVRVHGQAQTDVLALDGSAGSIVPLTTVPPNTMGEQSIAVLLVNFQDDTSQPKTVADANDLVFGAVSNHYQESSFGQTWFKGQVFGWYTIAMSKTVCDPSTLASLADAQAAEAGVSLGSYQRRVYMFPTNACGWQGLGALGGTNTVAWINGLMTLQVVGHELGHNYGLSHAHSLDCDTGVFGDTCLKYTYGDAADLMGNLRAGQFNPFEKEQLGWLNDGISPPITTVATSGRYSIEPYSAGTVGPKALKIPRGTDSTGRTLWYYVEYRQPIGGDSVLGDVGNLTRGVMVRTATEGDRESSFQLDMSPGSSTSYYEESGDGALAVGQSHVDGEVGVTLTLASTSSTGADIDVLIGTPTCIRAAPTVSLTSGSTAAPAGYAVGYTLSVTNRDNRLCPATTFALASSVPAGWTGTLNHSMTVSPGATASTSLIVTSDATAAVGSYGIGAATGSPIGALHTANASATYFVAPKLYIADTSLVEGNGGATMANFVISLAQPTVVPVTFNITTTNGTAAAGIDYTATSLAGITIPAGSTSAIVSVPVIGETAIEGNETFQVLVSKVVGATVSDGAATGTIRNDDTKLSIGDVSIVEGNAGTRSATFTVKLANVSASPVTFNIATANKTAVAGSDYAARSLSGQSIAAGSTSKTFTVNITGDRAVEANETFVVNVSGVKGATVTDAQAVGTIRNDDAVLSITDASAAEGNSSTKTLSFTVKLSAASASPVTFNIATANKTAVAGSDYLAMILTGQSIPAGSTSKVFKVTVKGDTLREANESFVVYVGSVSGATVGDAQGLGTIVNDD